MVWVPEASDERVSEACPRLLSPTAAARVPLTAKVTVPVGVRLELGWLTVAVAITDLPTGEGLSEVATESVVAAATLWTVTAVDDAEVAEL